jgi:hydroxyacylglutathione hydrolase
MKIEQLYTNCLAQGAYYIESNGVAAVIDPLREVEPYINLAHERGAEIQYIFETHFHADFVSGHLTLAQKTGAPIIFGPYAETDFECVIAQDGQEFQLGDLLIKVLHTPGHTMESTTYLLLDAEGEPHAIFTGDTLFLGDVGRPDLAQKATSMTQEDLAGILFDSLRQKLMPLPDHVIVYPGHGAGSACGKNMSKETIGLLGEQKSTNYALRSDMTKEEFIREVTDGLAPPPAYFPENVRLNREGYPHIDELIEQGNRPLSVEETESLVSNNDVLILDVRHQHDFVESHIPGSIFIGLDGTFAPWVGAIIKDVHTPIILICPQNRTTEAITRLARIGFDNVLGYVDGGMEAWAKKRPIAQLESITVEEAENRLNSTKLPIIDVRKESEYESEHILDALNLPLDNIHAHLDSFPKTPFLLHCAGGYRSVIAASVLKRYENHHVIDIQGGFGALKQTSIPKTDYICPSML